MPYEVHLSQACSRALEKMEHIDRERIINRLKRLSEDPYPTDSKFITRHSGDKVFRIRIGDHRALY